MLDTFVYCPSCGQQINLAGNPDPLVRRVVNGELPLCGRCGQRVQITLHWPALYRLSIPGFETRMRCRARGQAVA